MSSKNESYFKNIFDDWSALLSFPTSTAPIDFDTLVKTHLPAMSFDNDIDPLTGSASPSCPSDSSQTSSNPLWTVFYAKTEAIKQIEIDLDRLYPSFTSKTTRNNDNKCYFQTPRARQTLLHVLFVFAETNKSLLSEYKQGQHEIASVCYYVANEAFGEESDLVPGHTYALFSAIMVNLIPVYDVAGLGRSYVNARMESDTQADLDLTDRLFEEKKSYIVNECAYIQSIALRRAAHKGKELSEWLNTFNVIPQVYLLKWLRLMFIRESANDFDLLSRIWGSVFREFSKYNANNANANANESAVIERTEIKVKKKTTLLHLTKSTTAFLRQVGKIACGMVALRGAEILSTRDENSLLMLLMNYEFIGDEGKGIGDVLGDVIGAGIEGYGEMSVEERRMSLDRMSLDRMSLEDEAKVVEKTSQGKGKGKGKGKKAPPTGLPSWLMDDKAKIPVKHDPFVLDDDDDKVAGDTNKIESGGGGGGLFGTKSPVSARVADEVDDDEDPMAGLFGGERLSRPSNSNNLFGADEDDVVVLIASTTTSTASTTTIESESEPEPEPATTQPRTSSTTTKDLFGNENDENDDDDYDSTFLVAPSPPPPPSPQPKQPDCAELALRLNSSLAVIKNYLQMEGAGASPAIWKAIEEMEEIGKDLSNN